MQVFAAGVVATLLMVVLFAAPALVQANGITDPWARWFGGIAVSVRADGSRGLVSYGKNLLGAAIILIGLATTGLFSIR